MKANKLKGVLLTMLAVVVFVAMCIPSFMTISTKAATTGAKSINIGADNIKVSDKWTKADGNYVNFGKYSGKAVKYRVLSNDGSTMLIDSDSSLKTLAFGGNAKYATSTIRTAISDGTEFFPNATEKNIVKKTTLDGLSDYSFILSASEANSLYQSNADRQKSGTAYTWWLRSVHNNDNRYASYVRTAGDIFGTSVGNTNGVAPASNLDLTNVLFSSDAGFSKTVALANVNTTETKTWNLTIKDESKTVTAQKATIDAEKKVSVPVKLTGSNITQVSVVITNGDISSSDTEILYYGKLDGINASSTDQQTGTFTLPSDFNADTDKAYVLAEDLTSATSDLASAPVEINGFQEYTVDFDTNGATSGTADKQIIKYGEKIDKQAIAGLAKENYKLVGWYENSDFTGEAFDLDTPIEKSIKLYAKWEKEDKTTTKTTTKTTKVTKKGDSADNAKTGDEANIGLLAVLALSSLAAGTGVVAIARRKK